MRKLNGIIVAMILSLACICAGFASTDAAPYTPREWQPKLGNKWNLDQNNNNVEDKLDSILAANPSAYVGVILDLNDCPDDTDLTRLSLAGTIGYISNYLTVVQLKNVPIAAAVALGGDVRVAMVEENREVFAMLDISTRAMCVRASGTYSPNTVEDQYPTIDGAGVTIGIIDTGVDDGIHESLPGSKFVGGYNTFTGLFGNPDDDNQHGTHVASIAMGTGGLSGTYRGIAPGAKLADIKVLSSSGSGSIAGVIDGIDRCIQMKNAWNLRVINLSLGDNTNSNGLDAMSEEINLTVAKGIVAVVAAGNNGMTGFIPSPGAADYAITVGAADDGGTVDRAPDVIAVFSNRGPRYSDGDSDPTDELKPDVAAPGIAIMAAKWNTSNQYQSLNGTSMAAPHVAGLAALLIQVSPSITPLAVKSHIIQTAEDHGTSGWDINWG
jgi:serine protease AprX